MRNAIRLFAANKSVSHHAGLLHHLSIVASMRHICASLLFFIASSLCLAQDSRADVFGGYSYLNIDTNGLSSRQNANGWEASVSGNFNKWFAAEADVSGYYKNYSIDLTGLGLGTLDVKVTDCWSANQSESSFTPCSEATI